MAKPNLALLLSLLSILFFLVVLSCSLTAESSEIRRRSRHTTYPTGFIKSSCKATRYPALCVHCLSGYAAVIKQSDHHLAQTALVVSLSRARSAASYVAKLAHARGIRHHLRQYRAVKDCLENMADTVDRLGQSVRELGRTGPGGEFAWHMSNVQTWVSAALTDENTCMDGFGGKAMEGAVKAAVRHRVVGLAQVTSNALALVNRFASRHQAAAAAAKQP